MPTSAIVLVISVVLSLISFYMVRSSLQLELQSFARETIRLTTAALIMVWLFVASAVLEGIDRQEEKDDGRPKGDS